MINLHRFLFTTFATALLSFFTFSFSASAEVIHSERSLYRNVIVEDNDNIRCLKFSLKRKTSSQSCFDKIAPKALVFNYTKLLFSSFLMLDEPKNVLIIGLGGGTMSNSIHQLFPKARITNVEIDPAVVKVAREYFDFIENDQVSTVIKDGRIFIKRAKLKKQQFDWVILDAFNGDYIPEHLMTQEFLAEAKALLSENGILSANTFSLSKLYAHESATYKAVFGDFYQVANKTNSNRIILISKKGFSESSIKESIDKSIVDKLNKKLTPYGVDIRLLYNNMVYTKNNQDWPENTRVLTDQFSPANLLNVK